ncbi:MAG: dihydroorotate dehydrogenase (quinone) [Alphaproteobacteria bacterium]|nr:dihydroorotate dehydrogenase (quinone) [Alphaproteobacteria bacterium]
MNYKLISKLSENVSPEILHKIFLFSLRFRLYKKQTKFSNLQTVVFDKSFENPIGLAAGFDKNAEVIPGLFDLGFGFLELGTVTPMPQKGNEKPRIFKIPEYEAVIQRLGFNSRGIEDFIRNLKKFEKKKKNIIGINIGKNKNSKNYFSDYGFLYDIVEQYADYITINISSPNTPGLRDLQKRENINKLLSILPPPKKPTLIKISPDVTEKELNEICEIAIDSEKINGLILTNTTITRDKLLSKPIKNSWKIEEVGGLSGPPLKALSNKIIKKVFKKTEGKIILIGVGGISSGKDAFEKISLGCNLIQLYTSLIYQGPYLIFKILTELSYLLKKNNIKTISDLVGTNLKP